MIYLIKITKRKGKGDFIMKKETNLEHLEYERKQNSKGNQNSKRNQNNKKNQNNKQKQNQNKEKIIQEPAENMAQEEMTVELELDEGTVTCSVVTIFSVGEKDYIALLPLNEKGENEDGSVWIYGYSENPNDPNEEPVLRYFEDDEEYEQASDAFDEFLDDSEFDEMLSE